MWFSDHTHTAPKGYASGVPYGHLEWFAQDGMGVNHFRVIVRCATCGKDYAIANVHIANNSEILPESLKKRSP